MLSTRSGDNASSRQLGPRTLFVSRFVSSGNSIGTGNLRVARGAPIYPAQIELLETFADQAVIAIENVRLFQELDRVAGAANSDK